MTGKKLVIGMIAALFALFLPMEAYAASRSFPGMTKYQAQAVLREEQPRASVSAYEYYDKTVMIGDSVMKGFEGYCVTKPNTYLSRIGFLAAISYNLWDAMKPKGESKYHPVYMAEKRPVWESLAMMEAERVLIDFGLNDLTGFPVETVLEEYEIFCDRLLEDMPELDIVIMSMNYVHEGKSKAYLNNGNIDAYNAGLKDLAQRRGWGYMDTCTPTSDGRGNLNPAYCSDGYCHLNNNGYKVWAQTLFQYAADLKNGAIYRPTKEALPGWNVDHVGFWYNYDGETWKENEWFTDTDGREYYFDERGYVTEERG